ncbi:putative peptidoglycan muropeptide transporter SLC46 [Haemaphysalis longicornis]
MASGDPWRCPRACFRRAYGAARTAYLSCNAFLLRLLGGTEEETVCGLGWRALYPWLVEQRMEALLFAFSAAAAMPSTALTRIFQEQACRRSLSYSEDVCKDLSKFDNQRYQVYVVSRRYLLLSEGLLTLLSAVVAILAGPVCDKHGQKTLLGLAIAGSAGTSLVRAFLALGSSPMLTYVAAVIPMGITGGHVLVLACCYFAVTKNTNARLFRTIRFFLLDIAALIGSAVGWLFGLLLYSILGRHVSLWVALGAQCSLLAVLWASPVMSDSSVSTTAKKAEQLRALVSVANAREAAKIFGGHRELKKTLQLLFAIQALLATMNYGPDEILYPFTRLAYGWSYSHFFLVSAVCSLAVGVAGVFAVGCMRVVGVTDVTFLNVGAAFGCVRNLLIGLARVSVVFYLSYVPAVPQGLGPVGIKSYFSKLVPSDETGKFMALVTACESVFTVLSRVMLSFTFDVTATAFDGLAFILCALLVIPIGLCSGYLRPTTDSTSSTSSAPPPVDERANVAPGGGTAGGGPSGAPADGVRLPAPWTQLRGLAQAYAAQEPRLKHPVAVLEAPAASAARPPVQQYPLPDPGLQRAANA